MRSGTINASLVETCGGLERGSIVTRISLALRIGEGEECGLEKARTAGSIEPNGACDAQPSRLSHVRLVDLHIVNIEQWPFQC